MNTKNIANLENIYFGGELGKAKTDIAAGRRFSHLTLAVTRLFQSEVALPDAAVNINSNSSVGASWLAKNWARFNANVNKCTCFR